MPTRPDRHSLKIMMRRRSVQYTAEHQRPAWKASG